MSAVATELRPIAVEPATISPRPPESVPSQVLEVAADALLATAERVAARAEGDDPEPDPNPAAAQPRPRSRRRAPEGLTPEQAAERGAMITRHTPLVRYVANSMSRHAGQSVLLDYDDLLSYGTEGLIAAVDTFDATRGLKFSTWAVMHIRTTIQDALRTLDPLPRSLRAKGKEINRVSAELAHAQGAWPAAAEVAQALGQPIDTLRRTMQELGHTVVSLEAVDGGHDGASTSGDEGGLSLLNVLADDDPEVSPEERLDRRELSRLLLEAITALPEREEILIDAHYRRGQSMRAISRLLGISESRVSQLHARAIRLLREHLDRALSLEPVSDHRGLQRATRASRRSSGSAAHGRWAA